MKFFLFEPSTIDKLVKKRRRVLVGGSRQRRFIRSMDRLIVLQNGKEMVESKPAKASSPEDTSRRE